MDNEEYEEYREKQIKIWVKNSMNKVDAEQLMTDSESNANSNNLDIDVHAVPNIDDRANKYGSLGV